jgi:hypothetical protein
MKLFAAFSSERPFEFLIMQKAPMLVTTFVQICQHNAGQFNKSSHAADDALLSVLGKIVINGISTIRSLLRVVSDPSILEKGALPETYVNNRTYIAPRTSCSCLFYSPGNI